MAVWNRKSAFTVGMLTMLMVLPAFGASINKSVKIGAGEESDGTSSVNGSIFIGADAVVTGDVNTVNGRVEVESGAKIEDASTVNGKVKVASNVESGSLETVNGAISVGEATRVDGSIEAVNGTITAKAGSTVAEDIANVNGKIELTGARVGGDIETVAGDIHLLEGTVVAGDIFVEKPGGWGWGRKDRKKPRVVIGPGSSVEGTIRLEREVELYISDRATVGGVSGVMTMDDAVRFDGEKP